MGVNLLGWTWARAARLVGEVLAGLGGTGPIAVLDGLSLAERLPASGRPVIAVAARASDLRDWHRLPAVTAAAAALPIGDGRLGALVVVDPGGAGWEARYAEWARAVMDGGAIVVVGGTAREAPLTRALCAGLCDLEQRVVGRRVVTVGRVLRR